MARTSHAQTIQKSADLASEFGLAYATRLFGEEAIASLPVRTAGKNKGKPKGYVCWLKTTSPGYCVYVSGGAPADMVVRAWIGPGPFCGQDSAFQGRWLGRVQSLCGSRFYLGAEAREKEAARQAAEAVRDAAHWAEIKADMQAEKEAR